MKSAISFNRFNKLTDLRVDNVMVKFMINSRTKLGQTHEKTIAICFLTKTKSQKGQISEVKRWDKNARNLKFIKSDATKVNNVSRSLIGLWKKGDFLLVEKCQIDIWLFLNSPFSFVASISHKLKIYVFVCLLTMKLANECSRISAVTVKVLF